MKKSFLYILFWVMTIYLLVIFLPQVTHTTYSYERYPYSLSRLENFYHLLNFDGIHYQKIAQYGYNLKFSTAFFPLYPLLIRGVSLASFGLLSLPQSALLISLTTFLGSLILLWRLTKSDKVIISLLLFPLSFFFLAGYTESLFLFLSLLAYTFFKQKKYFWMGVVGYFAALTRFYGILLFGFLFLEYFFSLPKKKRFVLKNYLPAWPLLLFPLGLVTYMVYLYFTFGDPLQFIHALELWQKSKVTFPLRTLYRYARMLLTVSPTIVQYWVAFFEVAFFGFGLWVSLKLWLRKKYSHSLYLLAATLIPSFTGTLQSLPRYLITIFPLYIFLSGIKKGRRVYLIVSGVLQLVLLFLFLNTIFVA